jgi:cell division septation protein DedD
MKRLIACLVLTSALTVAACSDPQESNEPETADVTTEAPVAPAAEDAGVPAAAPSAVDTPPADTTTLSPEKRSSEESVKPESETLFY